MPRGLGGDERIKIMPYKANTVFQFTGCPYFQSLIEFASGETIMTIAMGTPSAWQIIPSENRIFLKPIELDATTNMTVITNKRMYFFEMRAKEAFGIEDGDIPFVVKFLYPNEIISNITKSAQTSMSNIDMKKLTSYNFDYRLSGRS
ncbi:TrbG/VirB9 family P-type conjugative transfer protein [Candidatus Cyrtobacter comes]|nr:TrbG/VirB9 family P-type conjugative transfer protein [Candidatus Cyrtobacter comes]